MKHAAFVYPLIGLVTVMALPQGEECCKIPPAPCYTVDESCCTFCLGPELVNPSVRPQTCNGDFVLTAAALCWNSHQDGMEYAIETSASGTVSEKVSAVNNLVDAVYKTPDFHFNAGFEVGLGYNSCHDGWDINFLWTYYRGSASSHNEAENEDNRALVALWSAFQSAFSSNNIATDIETRWTLNLNLLDASLGREFWVSKYLTMRPFIGLRASAIDQKYILNHKGGVWSGLSQATIFNNEVSLKNDFHGVGARSGFDTTWNFGRGFSLFSNMAVAIIYGRFNIKHDEWNRQALFSHAKTRVLETEDRFRASRVSTDLSFGVQWSTLFNECRNGFTILLAWEQHLFFDQNQMWRVIRLGEINNGASVNSVTAMENVYYQRRGDLDTQGLTLKASFTY